MTPAHVRLVAGREIRERVRARSFQISTVVAVVITVAAIVLPTIASNPLRSIVKVGVVDSSQRVLAGRVSKNQLGVEATVRYVALATEADADRALRSGRIHLAVIGDRSILLKEPIDPNDASPKVRLARVLSILPAIRGAPIPIRSVLQRPEHVRRDPTTALYGTILIYVFVFMYGSMILGGVVQEKGSRVIEILLATVPAKRLLAGKVIGIGAVALLQAAFVMGAALVSFDAVGRNPLAGSTGGQTIQMFGWFVLAYAFYACVYAAIGATISRQEEAQNVMFPISLPILIAYATAVAALAGGEESRLLRILSFLPPTAAIAMPSRVVLGTVTIPEVLLAVAGTIAATILVVLLAGTVYENSILRMGARVKLRDALRRPTLR